MILHYFTWFYNCFTWFLHCFYMCFTWFLQDFPCFKWFYMTSDELNKHKATQVFPIRVSTSPNLLSGFARAQRISNHFSHFNAVQNTPNDVRGFQTKLNTSKMQPLACTNQTREDWTRARPKGRRLVWIPQNGYGQKPKELTDGNR